MPIPSEFFRTARLIFRPFSMDDLAALATIVGDPEVARYVGDGVPLSRETTSLWIERSRANVERFGYGTGAVIEQESGNLVGWAGVARPEGEPEEIVYGFARGVWGRGYGWEIVEALVRFAFEALRLATLRATVVPANVASSRILARLGFRRVSWPHETESWLYVLDRPVGSQSAIESSKSPIERRLDDLRAGSNPRLVARVPSGWVELAPFQFRRGYCLLLADPIVTSLNDASQDVQAAFLRDMARVGDAVRAVTGAIRCNYSIYGNLDPFLHAHIVPRFVDEPEEERSLPPLSLPLAVREDPTRAFDPEKDRDLIERLQTALRGDVP